jgi:hypothetical protein
MTAVNPALGMSRPRPLEVLAGLLFRPSATLWKLRDEGPLWLSLVSAAACGGLGLGEALVAALVFGLDRTFWTAWMHGILNVAFAFGVTLASIQLAAYVVWRLGPSPVMPAGMRTLLRLGGYWQLPSGILSLASGAVLWFGFHSGSGPVLKAAIAAMVVLGIAGWIWVMIFRLRLLRTVYLTTWGQAISIGVIVAVLGMVVRMQPFATPGRIANLINLPFPNMATADVNWDLHLALGADPKIVEALESVPQANSTVGVMAMSGLPRHGDLVAYYRDREAPAVHGGLRLPRPIVIGRVVAGPEEEIEAPDWPAGQVPGDYALIRPVSDPRDPPHPSEMIPVDSIAGQVPETHLRLQLMVTRLLLR